MDGLRCPICKAISLVQWVNDGDIFTCPFCNYRYTVTTVRRYYLEPRTACNSGDTNFKNLDVWIKNLKSEQLAEVIQLLAKELSQRLTQERECISS